VLPIGGVREKVLAAYRLKLSRVILPIKNDKDLGEIPRPARTSLDIRLVEHMDEVLELSLVPKVARKKSSKARK
jgi:ATP-dependent Lon protease